MPVTDVSECTEIKQHYIQLTTEALIFCITVLH